MAIDFLGSGSAGRTFANRGFRQQKKGIDQGKEYLEKYTGLASSALTAGKEEGVDYIDAGVNQALPYLQQAQQPYQSLFDMGKAGVDHYGDLWGLNGQEAASAAYQGSPAYQFQKDQMEQSVLRGQAAGGDLRSGGTNTDLAKYIQGLASQDYFKTLEAGQPYFGLAQSGANGLGQGLANMANLFTDAGNNKANIATGTAGKIADSYTGLGTGLTGLALARGQAGYQNQQDLYGAQRQGTADSLGLVNSAFSGLSGLLGSGGIKGLLG